MAQYLMQKEKQSKVEQTRKKLQREHALKAKFIAKAH